MKAEERRRAGARRRALVALAGACACVLSTLLSPPGLAPRWSAAAAPAARWAQWVALRGVVDIAGPRADGTFIAAAGGKLWVVTRGRGLAPFAQGTGGYSTKPGAESYITVSPGDQGSSGGCAFAADDVFALELGTTPPSVIRVDGADGKAARFASAPAGVESLVGITFDDFGSFGGALLVVGRQGAHSVVMAIDCAGTVTVLTDQAPLMEGGVAVAPPGFGDYRGRLVGADENTGAIFAIDAHGKATTIVTPTQPTGGDIGVESLGFVPRGMSASGRGALLVADRGTPGSPHPGSDTILQMGLPAGTMDRDLVVVSEASARTVTVHCVPGRCTVTDSASGPGSAHVEGHVAFVPEGTAPPLGVTRPSLPGETDGYWYLLPLGLVGLFLIALVVSRRTSTSG